MVDAYLWAPKRCECEQAVVDGTLPFSQCSTFLSTFQCYHEAPCTATTWPASMAPHGYSGACPWCPKVGDKIPYYATISASQCTTLPTTGYLNGQSGKIAVNFDMAACIGGNYPNCKAGVDAGGTLKYMWALTPNWKCDGNYTWSMCSGNDIDGKGI